MSFSFLAFFTKFIKATLSAAVIDKSSCTKRNINFIQIKTNEIPVANTHCFHASSAVKLTCFEVT